MQIDILKDGIQSFKYIKRFSTSTIKSEIETTISCHPIPRKMATIRRKKERKQRKENGDKDIEKF